MANDNYALALFVGSTYGIEIIKTLGKIKLGCGMESRDQLRHAHL